MNPTINIGTEINLPDLLQSRLLIQANSGGGKSVLSRVIIEQTYGSVPFIVFDDAGEYYPLKEKYGDIVIIGDAHADVPISMQAVSMLPKFIIGNQLNVIIDLSAYDKQHTRAEFVKCFLDALMALGKQYWKSYFIFLEEAHKYCGEQDKQVSAGAVKELMSGGRKKGYCGVLITQRIAKLHKDAAAECNNKFIGRTFLDLDMDRAAKELGFTKSSEFTRLSLRDLEPGSFYAFGTSIQPHYVHKVKINLPQTKIIKVGQIVNITPKKPTAQLLEAMAKLNDLPKEAAQELRDMESLRQENVALKKQLAGKNIPQKGQSSAEVSVITEQLAKTKAYVFELQNEIKDLEIKNTFLLRGIKESHKHLSIGKEKTGHAAGILAGVINNSISFYQEPFANRNPTIREEGLTPSVLIKQPDNNTNGVLTKGDKTVLIACSQYKHGLNRKALTTITGYTRRTRDAYIFNLRNRGFIVIAGDKLVATPEGIKALGNNYEPLPTGRKLQEHWLKTLPAGERAILEQLVLCSSLSREEISELTGYTRRTRDAYIYNMLAKEIVTIPHKGVVAASKLLFD